MIAWALVCSLCLQPLASTALARPDGPCSEKIQEARQKFDAAAFADVISLLEPCLQGDASSLNKDEKAQAYELLAKTYSAQSLIDQATTSIKKLLEIAPNFQPNPDRDPPPFVDQVNQVKKEMASQEAQGGGEGEPFYKNQWFLIGGGVVAAAIIVAVVAGGKSESTPAVNNPSYPP